MIALKGKEFLGMMTVFEDRKAILSSDVLLALVRVRGYYRDFRNWEIAAHLNVSIILEVAYETISN